MTNLTNKLLKETVNLVGDSLYWTGRKTGWIAYTVIPGFAWAGAKLAKDAIDSIPWYNPANLVVGLYEMFGGTKIQDLEGAKNACVYTTAAGATIASTKAANLVTERIAPYRHNMRNCLEVVVCSLPTAAACIVSNPDWFDKVKELTKEFSIKEAFAQGTEITTHVTEKTSEIITNIPDPTPQNIMYISIATLGSMALYRLSEIPARVYNLNPISFFRDRSIERQADKRRKNS